MSTDESARTGRDAAIDAPVERPLAQQRDPERIATTEQSDRAQTFTRRGLIQWSVPVIFAVALADTAYAQITGHVDSHSDSGHVDQHADHTDNHGDQH